MPVALLDSQLATLEVPGADERPLDYDVVLAVDEIVADAAGRLAEDGSGTERPAGATAPSREDGA